ncbi:MAG: preprotein translocase subunit SecG [SAR202 cluster bacterium Io17-Chloro-G3]|nr:MAG: preprotein translocase subunit SecG [SAR202 cluster bacterium Io17-Chloro-G3]|tara:strand:+ start:572 stop:787 length:216 start_codon:yes stop_codon:yes gene_type:complete
MQNYFTIAEIIIAIMLIVVVLAQVRGQGSGMFGSAQSTFRTRRGIELTLFRFTVILGVLFALLSLGSLLLW